MEDRHRYEPRWLPAGPDDQGLRELAPYADRSYPCLSAGERLASQSRRYGTALGLLAYLVLLGSAFVFGDWALGAMYLILAPCLLMMATATSAGTPSVEQDARRHPTRAGRVALDQPRRLLAQSLDLSSAEARLGVAVGERDGQIVIARLDYEPCPANVHSADVDSRQGEQRFHVTVSHELRFGLDDWLQADAYRQSLTAQAAAEVQAQRNKALLEGDKRDLSTAAGQRQYELEQTVSLLREQARQSLAELPTAR